MLHIMPHNIMPDYSEESEGIPDYLIQTAPVALTAAEDSLQPYQPVIDNPPISNYHNMMSLSERDKMLAYMELAGNKNKDMAKAVNLTPGAVSQIRKRPEYRLFLSEQAKTLRESTHQSITDRIMGDSHRNLDVLMQIRDGVKDHTGTPDWNTRKSAAFELLSRQYPKINKSEVQEQHAYTFESKTFDTMFKALAGAMEVNPKGKSSQEVIDILKNQLPPGGSDEHHSK